MSADCRHCQARARQYPISQGVHITVVEHQSGCDHVNRYFDRYRQGTVPGKKPQVTHAKETTR